MKKRRFKSRKFSIPFASFMLSISLIGSSIANTITENFSGTSLGTTITGSSLFANTGSGVTIVNEGTGTGSGGFSGTGRHARFDGSGTRELRTIFCITSNKY